MAGRAPEPRPNAGSNPADGPLPLASLTSLGEAERPAVADREGEPGRSAVSLSAEGEVERPVVARRRPPTPPERPAGWPSTALWPPPPKPVAGRRAAIQPDHASLDATSRAILRDDHLWQGTPPATKPAWADEGAAAWDTWTREKARPVAVPVAVVAVVVAAVAAALTAAPGPVTGTPVAVADERPARKVFVPGAPPAPMPAEPSAKPPPPTPPPPAAPEREAPRPEAQAPGTVRLAQGGTATLVRKDVIGGVLPVPDGVREATWWGAPFDGARGATVLAGHVNWKGATGPFAELWEARLGDQVTVVGADGATFRYRVRQLVTVHKDELPARAQELFGQDGAHRLVLVTCGGRWVGGHDGYEENRIVVADPM